MNLQHVYRSKTINFDFHSIPHWGKQSALDTHWVPTRGKPLKSALTLFAQDCQSGQFKYAQADILRSEATDQILDFISFWKKIHGKLDSTLVFDSKLTSYENLNEINKMTIHFITLRRGGKKLIEAVNRIPANRWKQVHLDIPKRKYKAPCFLNLWSSLMAMTTRSGRS
ncbi:MAG: hypothetical protein SWO11_15730 [Thermodesulfobacteriota bacterium]|nr:hypothetical protein [Thermodesulfobacteriota bacterium]